MTEQTLVLIKPDSVQRGLIGRILARFEDKGLQPVAMRMVQPDHSLAAQHYAEHEGRYYYPKLMRFITSSPLVAVVLAGDQAIGVVRNLIGSTDGREAAPGTIRGDLSISGSANLVHASDGPESAAREIALWFPEGTCDWVSCASDWLDAPEVAS